MEVTELLNQPDPAGTLPPTIRSYLLIGGETGAYQTCGCSPGADPVVRYFRDACYYLKYGENQITIANINAAYSNIRQSDRFHITSE